MTTPQHSSAADDGEPERSSPAPSYPISSVDNALRLLGLFSTRQQVRVSEASRELGVAHSTAHRLMQMLCYHEYVRQDAGSKAYLPGPELVRIGLAVIAGSDLREVSRPWIEQLVAEVQETVHLVELQGDEVVFLDSVESPRVLRIGARTGFRLPAHATASGKVMLAGLSTEELHRLLPSEQLQPVTSRSTTDRAALEAELEQVRARGYAANFAQSEPDVHAVAVPVIDARGTTRAALSITAPPFRLAEQDVEHLAARATAIARQIGGALPG